ncbi:cell division protein ZapA [Serratia fonticola]|nr:cell division protein ZapA [Serratia fonticola]TQI95912.1 cell division protein ZapA [Serratia fonticola]TVZ70409.1 cell division protein ZapA [Serratia fonticola]
MAPALVARQWQTGAGAKFRQEGGMSAQPVDIQIFGRSLRVNCPPEQQDALNMAAEDLNQRLQDLKVRTRVTNTEQLVFIAALNVCHELAQERLKTRDYAANMEQRIRMLQQTIEQALLEQGRISERQDAQFE